MRRILVLLLSLALIISISACNSQKLSSAGEQNINTTVVSSEKPEDNSKKVTTAPISTSGNSTTQTRQPFFGEWEIKKKIITPGLVSDNSPDDIKRMIGKKISYEANLASYGEVKCKNPIYKITKISKSDFEIGNNVSFESLGIKSNSITQVLVYPDTSYKDTWDSIGNVFYIKDDNTLILYVSDYLEMVRIK